jgi:hypothetical protein
VFSLKGSEAFERDADVNEAIDNIADTIVSLEDKLRKQKDESETKIEEQVS